MLSTIAAGFMFRLIGIQRGLQASFTLSTLGLFLICVWGWDTTDDSEWTLPILVLVAKFGVSASFNIVYLGNAVLFPTLFSATSMSICNIVARTASIAAPFIAEIDGVTPMWIALSVSVITLISTFFIQKPRDESNY